MTKAMVLNHGGILQVVLIKLPVHGGYMNNGYMEWDNTCIFENGKIDNYTKLVCLVLYEQP